MGCAPSMTVAERSRARNNKNKQSTDLNVAASSDLDGSDRHLESFTILLVGAGDSGKSTIRKQLSNIYESQFRSPDLRRQFSNIVIGNILDGTLQVLGKMEGRKELFGDLQTEARMSSDYVSPNIAKTLLRLYFEDKEFRETFKYKASEVQVPDSYHSFMKKLRDYPTWGGPQWIPSEEDCVRARARTTGITKVDLIINRRKFTIIDVGGQRAERKKWLNNHCNIAKVSLVVFVASLSEYNQQLFEERAKNRLEESLDLFSECINSDWLYDIPVVLFLNKKDVFDKKYTREGIPLNVSGKFPDAPQSIVPTTEAITWIVSRFAKRRKCNQKLAAYVLTATSPSRVKAVFDQCTDLLIKREFLVEGGNVGSKVSTTKLSSTQLSNSSQSVL